MFDPLYFEALLAASYADRQRQIAADMERKRAEAMRQAEQNKKNEELNAALTSIAEMIVNAINANEQSSINEIADSIDDILFNDPATVVFWSDGTKTVVRCSDADKYDPVDGLAMACLKKVIGDNYYKMLKETVVVFKYMLRNDEWNLANVNAKLAEFAKDYKAGLVEDKYIEHVLADLMLNRDANIESRFPEFFSKIKYDKVFKPYVDAIFADADEQVKQDEKSVKEPSKQDEKQSDEKTDSKKKSAPKSTTKKTEDSKKSTAKRKTTTKKTVED